MRRVHWAADGMPVLDMQADEELDPAYRRSVRAETFTEYPRRSIASRTLARVASVTNS